MCSSCIPYMGTFGPHKGLKPLCMHAYTRLYSYYLCEDLMQIIHALPTPKFRS